MGMSGSAFQSLQPGVNQLTDLVLGNKNKMQQAQQQQGLDIGKYQAERGSDIENLQKLKESGLISEGGGAKAGEMSVSRGYDMNKLQHQRDQQQTNEFKALQSSAKPIKSIQDDLETADMIHKLAEDPSQVDMGTAQVMKARMALGTSGGRAISAAMHAMGADKDTLAGDAEKLHNFLTGQAKAIQTPDQINALKEGAFKLGDEATEKLQRAKQQFGEQAPGIAPGMAGRGDLDRYLPTFTNQADQLAQTLAQRKQAYKQSAAQQGMGTGLNPSAQAAKKPQSFMSSVFGNLFGGGQQQQQAAPQQGAGGPPPGLSFEQFKQWKQQQGK
jgi:hypothetical protein